MEVSTGSPAPLKLCESADVPPAAIAGKPSYAEYVVVATDAAGKPLSGLKQQDFRVSDDGKVMPIEFFRGDASPSPVSIAIVLDSSGSMANKLGTGDSTKLKMVRDSISKMLGNLDSCDEVALITFGGHPDRKPKPLKFARGGGFADQGTTEVDLAPAFTTDHPLVLTRLDSIHPYGQTPLYDSIHDALRALTKADYPRRAMLVITDGMDNTSTTKLEDLLGEARNSRVPIYSIGMGDPNTAMNMVGHFVINGVADYLDASALNQLSAVTGGETFVVSPADNDTDSAFKAALAKIAAMLARGYAIGVVAAGDRPLTFAVATHPDAKVQAARISSSLAAKTPPVQASANH